MKPITDSCLKLVQSLALPALLLLLASSPIHAATLTWTGGAGAANRKWSASANWGGAGVPASGDTLILPGGVPGLSNTNDLVGRKF